MSDCCNAIAADGEAGAGCSHIGLTLHRPVMKPTPWGQKAANSMSVPRGKSRHQTPESVMVRDRSENLRC